MPNAKSNSSDPKNSADSKNNNSASKNNNADQKNNNAATKNNADLTKSNSTSKKDNCEWKGNLDAKTNADAHPPQGDAGGGNLPPSSGANQYFERQSSRNGNKVIAQAKLHASTIDDLQVYKSGPLFLSSKGIGWTSWKKRWFILTDTSLVFFRSDPNASSEKGGEANLTLGGIDLNSSGSVVVKADKKLLTVLFPDGRDGRSFTLKAETSEDLFEWKAALEEALANAPSAGTGMGQTGISKNEKSENPDGSHEQPKDRSPPKSLVLGRPVLFALEDIDGTPSFLEKALRYVEEHGIKVEGILRQAADVELVERRIREYEQGKTEFTAEEDGHVIGDCIKYVLRELPSSPVPASCCKALLQAFRTDRSTRVSCMRAAICDTFPEPNRRLLQRILMTMQAVAENKDVNRMSVPAVAACMSPLLLRPLLAGEVELENEFNIGDGSAQLMQAAAAANHAQAIIITLLEEYDNIFGAKKKTSIENVDVIAEERDEIFRLEALKADLVKKIEAERERELRKILEAGLTMSKKILPLPGSIDEKTKADLEDIAQAEAEVISLQQKLDDLEIHLSQHDQGKVKDKEKDRKSKIFSKFEIDDDKNSGKEQHDKHPFHSFSSKLPPNQQPDSTRKGEPSMSKSSSSTAANTSSALSKITNRLNFLKERRNQITNELDTVDKEPNKGQSSTLDESDDQSSLINHSTDNKASSLEQDQNPRKDDKKHPT
ncbi:Pleckstrin homology domain-containing protein, partial [Cynara cardunculus var. scolymus]